MFRSSPPARSVVDGAVAEHLEILRGAPGGRVGVRLVPCVCHAHAVHGALLDAVDRIRRGDAGRFEDGFTGSRSDRGTSLRFIIVCKTIAEIAGPKPGGSRAE